MDDGRIVSLTRDIAAPRRRVWEAFTRAADLCAWDPDEVSCDLVPAGTARFAWNHLGVARDMEVSSWMEECEIGLRSPEPQPEQQLTVLLHEIEGGTRVHLKFSGFETEDQRAGAEAGWRAQLAQLAFYLEHHDGKPRTVTAVADMIQGTPAEIFAGMASHGGLAAWLGEVVGPVVEGATLHLLSAEGADLGGDLLVLAEPYEFVVGCDAFAGLLRLRALPLLANRAAVVAAILSTWGAVPERAEAERSLVAGLARLGELLGSTAGEA